MIQLIRFSKVSFPFSRYAQHTSTGTPRRVVTSTETGGLVQHQLQFPQIETAFPEIQGNSVINRRHTCSTRDTSRSHAQSDASSEGRLTSRYLEAGSRFASRYRMPQGRQRRQIPTYLGQDGSHLCPRLSVRWTGQVYQRVPAQRLGPRLGHTRPWIQNPSQCERPV